MSDFLREHREIISYVFFGNLIVFLVCSWRAISCPSPKRGLFTGEKDDE